MKVDLAGHAALVTGAARGFGRAIAVALTGVGAAVTACDVLADGVVETATFAGPRCTARRLDGGSDARARATAAR